MILRLSLLSGLLGLAGCGAAVSTTGAPAPAVVHDPLISSALESPLLVDPDLSQQNARNLAIVPPGPVQGPGAD